MNRAVLALMPLLACVSSMPAVATVEDRESGFTPAGAWPRKDNGRSGSGRRARKMALVARMKAYVAPTPCDAQQARNKRKAARKGGRS